MSTIESVETPEAENQTLLTAVDALFAAGVNNIALMDGTRIMVLPAKLKQIGILTRFFGRLVDRLEATQLALIVGAIANAQKQMIVEGKNPREIGAAELLAAEDKQGKSKLWLALFNAAIDDLPELAYAFSTLPAGRYDELDLDEGILLAGAIFMVNYDFFTQRLSPILMAFASRIGSKIAAQKQNDSPISTEKGKSAAPPRQRTVARK